MLHCDASSSTDALCEKCAGVMKMNQLSPSSFLARFFDANILKQHAILLNKSGKGSAAVLSERIEAEWAKNRIPPDGADRSEAAPENGNGDAQDATNKKSKEVRKRSAEEVDDKLPSGSGATPKKKKKSAKPKSELKP